MNKILNVVMMLLLVSVAVSAAPVTIQDGNLNLSKNLTVQGNEVDSIHVKTSSGSSIFRIDALNDIMYTGLLRPRSDANYDVGQSSNRYKNAYFSGNLSASNVCYSNGTNCATTSDTNETTRFNALVNTDCSGTDKVTGVLPNGTVVCGSDLNTGSSKQGDGFYLTNDSTTIYFNETKLNNTIDLRDSDTTYTNGTGLSLVGTTFSVALSYFQDLFLELTDSLGGDVSGAYNALQVTDNSHNLHWDNVTSKPANLDTDSTDDLTSASSWSGDLSGTGLSPQVQTNSVISDVANVSNTGTIAVGGDASGTVSSIVITDNSHLLHTDNITAFSTTTDLRIGLNPNKFVNSTNNYNTSQLEQQTGGILGLSWSWLRDTIFGHIVPLGYYNESNQQPDQSILSVSANITNFNNSVLLVMNDSNPHTNITIFTASGTWVKPAGAKIVTIIVFGGGGGGGGGASTASGTLRVGGSGGGGGAKNMKTVMADDLSATEVVTVGAGGASVAAELNGNAGGTSAFGEFIGAFGGGPGRGTSGSTDFSGGGGGGVGSVGGTGSTVGTAGGFPSTVVNAVGISGGGGGGDIHTFGAPAEYGGGGGGATPDAGFNGQHGGTSLFGGTGGGGGGGEEAAGTGLTAGQGGGQSSWSATGGGGAAAGTTGATPTAGQAGTNGNSNIGGGGGGGGGGATDVTDTGGAGGDGGTGGGGGGGGGSGSTGGASGAGGRGEVRVYVYY